MLAQDVAILVSTAYLDEAERCNRIGLIDHGKLLASGSPQEVKALMRERVLTIHQQRSAGRQPAAGPATRAG